MAAVAALLLSGCGPDTTEARRSCIEGQVSLWELEHPDATVEEYTEHLVEVTEWCEAVRDADPDGFVEIYG